MPFTLLKDRPKGTISYQSPASTLQTIGFPTRVVNNAIAVPVSGNKLTGLIQTAKAAADSSTSAVEIVPLRSDDILVADISTGTMADSFVDTAVDLRSGSIGTLDLTATANGDFLITGWDGTDTTKCYGKFTNLAY